MFDKLFSIFSGLAGSVVGTGKGVFTIISMIPSIIHAVELISKAFEKKPASEEKHRAAVELIRKLILAGEGITNKDIIDEELFSAGLDQVIDGAVKMLNASIWNRKSADLATIAGLARAAPARPGRTRAVNAGIANNPVC